MEQQEMLDYLADRYESRMPFHRLIGAKVDHLSLSRVRVRLDMKDELIGNHAKGILHAGVISSVLALTGGLIASVELYKRLDNPTLDEFSKRLDQLGAIDQRADFLRAGKANFFTATGSVLRQGRRIAVIRTELNDDTNTLIAAGTGSYIVG